MHEDAKRQLICLLMMPKCVADQRRKFDTDELFITLSRLTEVRYTGLPSGSDEERRTRFQQDCHDGRIEIACIPSGLNLDLYVTQSPAGSVAEGDPTNRDCIEVGTDRSQARICCHLILNGVCVRWRGWIDSNTLRGQGCIEFDEEGARVEDQRLQQELRTIEERMRYLDHRQPFLHNLTMPTIPAEMIRPVGSGHPGSSRYPSNHGARMPLTSASGPIHLSSSSPCSSPETA